VPSTIEPGRTEESLRGARALRVAVCAWLPGAREGADAADLPRCAAAFRFTGAAPPLRPRRPNCVLRPFN